LLITAWLIAEYKDSIDALAALEKSFWQKYFATSQTLDLIEISPVPSLIWCKKLIGL